MPFGLLEVGYLHQVDLIVTQSVPDVLQLDVLLFAAGDKGHEGAQMGVGVRNGMGKIDNVTVINKFILETQRVVGLVFVALFVDVFTFLVGDVAALPDPPDVPLLVSHHGEH